MAIFEALILDVLLWYFCGIIGIIIMGNIARCLQFHNKFKIIVYIFIILMFPLSLLWFINHAILQIPSKYCIKNNPYLLLNKVMFTETLSQVLYRKNVRDRCRWTLVPNMLFIIIVVLFLYCINAGFNGTQLIVLIIISLVYLTYYIALFLRIKRCGYIMCAPCASIYITILSMLTWILVIMRLFNIIGFKIFGLNEKNWDTIFQDICGCTCNQFEQEYNNFTKYLKWYVKERNNILNIHINDSNVIDIIIDYLNGMEYPKVRYPSYDSVTTYHPNAYKPKSMII